MALKKTFGEERENEEACLITIPPPPSTLGI